MDSTLTLLTALLLALPAVLHLKPDLIKKGTFS